MTKKMEENEKNKTRTHTRSILIIDVHHTVFPFLFVKAIVLLIILKAR